MRIPSATFLPPTANPLTNEQFLQKLTPGQLLQGTALSGNQKDTVTLQIGANRFIAQTQLSLEPGQPLTLKVDKPGPHPELKLLLPKSPQELRILALKTTLPRQQPITPLLEKLVQVTRTTENFSPPREFKQVVESLLNNLASTNKPNFKTQLMETMFNNGLFTEARLVRNTSETSDLKLNLLRLMRLLQTTSPKHSPIQSSADGPGKGDALPVGKGDILTELIRQLDGVLARIQTHQLASLPSEDPLRQSWQFELPILHGDGVDLFQILVKKEPTASKNQTSCSWNLTLHMNLQPLGPMRVQLVLVNQTISAAILAEQEDTTTSIINRLELLKNAFERAGLEVKKLEVFHGQVETLNPLPKNLSLLSEKA